MSYKITKLDHQGRGITKIDEKIVFVENALPSEEVEINIHNNKKKYMEANVVKYISKSDKRVESDCIYYDKCGGCDLRHIKYEDTLKFKEDKGKEVINKFTGLDIKINPIIKTNPYNYRNKVSFKVDEVIGYYKKKTNDIIKIEKCLLLDERINIILEKISKIDLKNVINIIIRSSKNTNDIMIIFEVKGNFDLANISDLKEVSSIIVKENNTYKTIYKLDNIYEKLDDLTFIISPESFFQVNTEGCLKLYNKVKEVLDLNENDNVLDLFCGTGTIGIYLSKYVKKVIGVEINKYAVLDANKNKELNKINNIEFICEDVNKIIDKFKDIDVVVVDPPRSGLDKNMIDSLIKINPKQIAYVSCDPITLARDLKILSEEYEIKEITPVDMFPYTCHVECVCLLKSKNI